MGHGIAQEFASAGYHVRMHDVTDEHLQTARTQIEKNLKVLAENAIIEEENIHATLQRIQTATELATVAENADFVVEAVTENLPLKQQIFEELDAICPPHTILASNTTALMPSQIGVNAKRKDKILNTHYFNPPYLIPLVELIRSPDTSDETVSVAFELLTAIGKTPAIIEKEALGFVGPRLQAALIREAFAIVERGIASAETVDLVVRNSFGRRLSVAGPFEVFELAGWDLVLAAFEELYKDLNSSSDINPLLRQMVESGKLGVKSKEGFYEWTDEKVQALRDKMNQALIQQAKDGVKSSADSALFRSHMQGSRQTLLCRSHMQGKLLNILRSAVHKNRFFLFFPVILVGLVLLGIYHKHVWEYLRELTAAFQSLETAREYIASYGVLAPIVSAILMIFQSVIAPLPAFLITFANGLLFGVWWGAALSWSSAMLGAALCFFYCPRPRTPGHCQVVK